MLGLAFCLAAPVFPAAGETQESPTNMVTFFNTDQIQGQLLEITPEGMVRWQHPYFTAQVEFAATNVASINLPALASVPPPPQARMADIELTNGDLIHGALTELTADTLKIDTWIAGPLAIPRPMIATITPNLTGGGDWYFGPNSINEWTTLEQDGAWVYEGGSLTAINRGTITRDCKLGDMSQIEFDMKWESYPSLRLVLYHPDIKDNPRALAGSYLLEISGNRAMLRFMNAQGSVNNVGDQAQFDPSVLTRNQCRVGIFCNRTKNQVNLFINNKLVQQWIDDNANRNQGTYVSLACQMPGLSISKIRIGPWNGILPVTDDLPASDEDSIIFVNQDRVTGKVESFAQNKISLKTAQTPMTIPMERVALIQFGTKTRAMARRRNGDARCQFVDGSSIVMQIQSLNNESLAGKSENFGQATFKRPTVVQLTLNIYSDRHQTDKRARPGRNPRTMMFTPWDFGQ
jgi:hypothetical protein